jgi:RNA polymerase sigma-70 factor, ECF subfamily
MAQVPTDDKELLRQLSRGNEAAFAECYRRFQQRIYRFVWHMGWSSATAEDVTQEVFVRLMKNPRGYDPERGSLVAYLLGIARNVLRRHMESHPFDMSLEDDSFLELIDPDSTSELEMLSNLDRQEQLECLRKAIASLPEPYREAVVLCDLEELSYPETAVLLGCQLGTVASRLHRARTMLKLRLKAMGCVR